MATSKKEIQIREMIEEDLKHIPDLEGRNLVQTLFRAVYADFRKKDLGRSLSVPRSESLHRAILAVHNNRGHRRPESLLYDHEYFDSYAQRGVWDETQLP